jgi:hypothetical protein
MVGEIVESVLIIVQTLFRVFVQSTSFGGANKKQDQAPTLRYVFDSSDKRQFV